MYEFITFLCSMSIMILELAGVRILTPFLGGTHIVYTSAIGIIMACLSFGYFLGGKLSIKNVNLRKLSLLIFIAGVYVLFLSFFQFEFLKKMLSLNLLLICKSLISSLVIFSLPSVFLGMVSPYIIQLVANNTKNNKNPGEIAGYFYAISTIGSIFGTFLTGFYLIITFGIDSIFFFLCLILFFCAFLVIILELRKNLDLLVLYIIFIILSFISTLYFRYHNFKIWDNSIFSKTTMYNYINIREYNTNNKIKRILYNNYAGIYLNESPEKYIFNYIYFFHYLFENKLIKNEILMLGNSIGSLSRGLLHFCNRMNIKNINFDIVEIDKEYTKLGEIYFELPKNDKRLTYFYEDARTFLNKDIQKKYDIIYFDIYSPDNHIFPFHLITKEAIEKIYLKLASDGIFAMNIIGSRKTGLKRSLYINQIYTQIDAFFPETKLYKTKQKDYDHGNYIIIGFKNPNDGNSIKIKELLSNREIKDVKKIDKIFTDNFAPVEKFL